MIQNEEIYLVELKKTLSHPFGIDHYLYHQIRYTAEKRNYVKVLDFLNHNVIERVGRYVMVDKLV